MAVVLEAVDPKSGEHRRAEGHAPEPDDARARRALRARVRHALALVAPERPPGARARDLGRPALLRHGVPAGARAQGGRRELEGALAAGTLPPRREDPRADRESPRAHPSPRPRPPRRDAVEHLRARGRDREADGFRRGPRPELRGPGRRARRHRRVHGSRADRERARRREGGPLLARRRALPDAHRTQAVQLAHARRLPRQAPPPGGQAAAHAPSDAAREAGSDLPVAPREGSRRSHRVGDAPAAPARGRAPREGRARRPPARRACPRAQPDPRGPRGSARRPWRRRRRRGRGRAGQRTHGDRDRRPGGARGDHRPPRIERRAEPARVRRLPPDLPGAQGSATRSTRAPGTRSDVRRGRAERGGPRPARRARGDAQARGRGRTAAPRHRQSRSRRSPRPST